MLASRGFNIDSLAVGETEHHDLSRMTFVVHGDDNVLDQVRKQLDKIVTVVRVDDISSENFVERDLMLIKIGCSSQQRPEVFQLAESFRGRVVDIQHRNVMIEISGTEGKVEAFIDLMRPYGILELARTGRIAMVRGDAKPNVAEEGNVTSPLADVVLPTRRLDPALVGNTPFAQCRRSNPHDSECPGWIAELGHDGQRGRFAE